MDDEPTLDMRIFEICEYEKDKISSFKVKQLIQKVIDYNLDPNNVYIQITIRYKIDSKKKTLNKYKVECIL